MCLFRAKTAFIMWTIYLIKEPKLSFKYFLIWIKSVTYPNKLAPMPWMTIGALDWFENNVNKDYRIFEWGTGNSTLYWVKRAKYVCSVEHDANWHKQIKQKLSNLCLDNYEYKLEEPEKGSGYKYASTDNRYKDMSFEKYCKAIESFPDNYFDMIVIDGRARVACAKLAISKVKNGGYIVLDNSEREEYQPIFNLLNGWKEINFMGPGIYKYYAWATTIFLKK